MTTRNCGICSAPLVRKEGEEMSKFTKRKFCGRECATAHSAQLLIERTRQRRLDVLEDVEWIAGTDHPERIARRLGLGSLASLERSLYRWGRGDLYARVLSFGGES